MGSRPSWLVLLLAVAATGCALADGDGQPNPNPNPQPDPQPLRDRLAFSSNRNGDYEIFTANTDGTDVTLLGAGGQPAWSRDGQRIAFDLGGFIYTMNRDGSDAKVAFPGTDPAWSPNDQSLMFTNDYGIVIGNLTTAGITNVYAHQYCQDANGDGMCATPRYAPDGSKIVFVLVNPTDPLLVQVLPRGGSVPSPLTSSSGLWSDSPTWTFDSTHVVYTTVEVDGTVDVVEATGASDPVTLATGFDISVPAISPDASAVAYQYSPSSAAPARIWIKPEVGSPSQLIPDVSSTNPAYEDIELAWSRAVP